MYILYNICNKYIYIYINKALGKKAIGTTKRGIGPALSRCVFTMVIYIYYTFLQSRRRFYNPAAPFLQSRRRFYNPAAPFLQSSGSVFTMTAPFYNQGYFV